MKRAFRCFLGRITEFQLQRIVPWSCSAVRRLRLCISFSVKALDAFLVLGQHCSELLGRDSDPGEHVPWAQHRSSPLSPSALDSRSYHKNRDTDTYF